MWDVILEALKAAWNWILETLFGFGEMAIEWILSLLPTDANGQVSSGWSVISYGINAANAWAPLDFAITLAFLYVLFVLSFLSVKILLKLIP
jgi:hypothetical protein